MASVFGIVILDDGDIRTPGIDGLQLQHRLRQGMETSSGCGGHKR
jgi:FixJ family two-component response regulator